MGQPVPSLTNGSNNRVVTATGTAAMTGESNLVFDGTKLGIGQSSPATLLNVKGNETAYSSNVAVGAILQLEDSVGRIAQFIAPGSAGDAGVGTKTANHFQIFASNSTKVFISGTDSSSTFYGDINIQKGSGSASANLKLQSHDTANATSTIQFLARDNSNNNETCYIQANSGSTEKVDLRFATGSGEHLRIRDSGQVQFISGTFTDNVDCIMANGGTMEIGAQSTMKFRTGTNERIRITSDGKIGINEISPQSILDVRSEIGSHPLGAIFRKDYDGDTTDASHKVALTIWGQDHNDIDHTTQDAYGPMIGFGARNDDAVPNTGDIRAAISYRYNGNLSFHTEAGGSVTDGSNERLRILSLIHI